MVKIKYTKKGQPYIIQANGRAKFIKKGSRGTKKKSYSRAKSRSPKRKSRSVYRMSRRKKAARRSGTKRDMFSYLKTPAIGAGAVVLYEATLSPTVNNLVGGNPMLQDIVELAGGMYLAKKHGIAGAAGKALITLNAYQLIARLANNIKAGGLSNVLGSTQQTNNYVY